MKNHTKIVLVLISVLVVSNVYMGNDITQPTTGENNVDTSIAPGNTYWYNVTHFPSFETLLNMSDVSLDENTTIDIQGDLSGSDIYVKVLDINNETQTYYDGTNNVTGELPVFDIATGLITSQDITINVTSNGNTTIDTIPQGIAIPIPFLFGGATHLAFLNNLFNLSLPAHQIFFPMPIALNDGYSTHQSVVQQASSILENGTLAVTNDASQFRIDANEVGLNSSYTLRLNGHASWRKTDGLLNEINFEIGKENEDPMFSMDIDHYKTESNGVNVQVGDKFNLTLADAGFDYTATGNDSVNVLHDLDQIHGNLTSAVGTNYVEFEVVETDGMYYRVEGSIYNDSSSRIFFPNNNTDDIWMHGFGRMGPGVPIPMKDPTNATQEVWKSNETDGTGYYDLIPVHVRERAIPGPFISSDYEIYQAWDKTMYYFMDSIDTNIVDIINSIESTMSHNSYIASSFSSEPYLELSWDGFADSSGYTTSFSSYLDMEVFNNVSYFGDYVNDTTFETETNYSEFNHDWMKTNINGTFNMNQHYNDKYQFKNLIMYGEGSLTVEDYYAENYTEYESWSYNQVNISNFAINITASYDTVSTETTTTWEDTSSSTTESSTTYTTSESFTQSDTTTSETDTNTDTTSDTSSNADTDSATSDTSSVSSTTTTSSSSDVETTPVESSSTPDNNNVSETPNNGTTELELPGFGLITGVVGIFSATITIATIRRRK